MKENLKSTLDTNVTILWKRIVKVSEIQTQQPYERES